MPTHKLYKEIINMNNLHVTITPFIHLNESRIKKEVQTIVKSPNVSKVFVAAKHKSKHPIYECLDSNIIIERIVLKMSFLSSGFISQGLKYFEFLFKVFFRYRSMDISTVNLHSYSLLPLAPMFKYLCKSKIIYDAHELETEKHGLIGIRKKIAKIIEYIFIGFIDEIIVVSDSISNWYTNEYKINKPTIIYNYPSIKENITSKVLNENYFRNKFGIRKNQLIFLYQGGLLSARGVDKLLEAFEKMPNDKNVCVFMGYGELESKIKEVASSCNSVFFHSAVPSHDLLSYTSSADIGIHLIPNTCLNHDYCMPNKLFEYLNAGIPVLVSNVKDMGFFVTKNKVGIVTDTTSVEDIIDTVDSLKLVDLKDLKQNVHNISSNCTWASQEIKLLNLY